MACRLDSKVALVTGAARGLGRAYALALARAGARVVVNDVAAGEAPGPGPVVQEIRAHGGRAIGILESVARTDGVRRIIDETVAAFGHLDIVVNNAGIARPSTIVDMTDADFDEVVNVHLRGTFLCTRAAMRLMMAGGHGGRIINIASGRAYYDPSPATANYAAAKGAIISFTGVAAAEGRGLGITCNAVSPLARTPLSAAFLGDDPDPTLDPESIAPLIVFLASDAAAAITGRVFRMARGEIAEVTTTVGPAMRAATGRWTAEEIAKRIGEICPSAAPASA